MAITTTESFRKYLKRFSCDKSSGLVVTHTSIDAPPLRLHVPDEKLDEFLTEYQSAMVAGVQLHLTEKPLIISPLTVDLDFRFPFSEEVKRVYTDEHILKIVSAYITNISSYLDVPDSLITAYVMEKPEPKVERKKIKDGIHIVFPNMVVDIPFKHLIRKLIIDSAPTIFEGLPILNSFDEVVDEAIIERNNWQMYGSCKPNCSTYKVTQIIGWDSKTKCVVKLPKPTPTQELELVQLLSLRKQRDIIKYRPEKENEIAEYIKFVLPTRDDRRKSRLHSQIFTKSVNSNKNHICEEERTVARTLVLECLNPSRAESYEDWIKLGWCLRNIDIDLLPTWVEFSKMSSKYIEGECQKCWEQMSTDTLGMGTLRWWAKQDNIDKYLKIVDSAASILIDKAAGSKGTHWDVAMVVHAMYKDAYCYTCENWYAYSKDRHRWVRTREATLLQRALSLEVCMKFMERANHWSQQASLSEENRDTFDKRARVLIEIATKLKTDNYKSSVVKQCKHMFTNDKFEELLDSHPHLLGFENGVYDLRMHTFRDGLPDDYISFGTNINYVQFNPKSHEAGEIKLFMEQVFVNPEIRKYMWDLLSTVIDGGIRHERFYICTGSGCHAPGTEVIMYDGSKKKVENITIGDILMGDDSTPRTVLELFHGNDTMYLIKPEIGEWFEVNGDHVLSLKNDLGEVIDITVKNYLANKRKYCKMLLYKNPVTYQQYNNSYNPSQIVAKLTTRVPEEYRYDSRTNRLKLLSAILETNTHENRCETLIDDIIELSRSLGYKSNKVKNRPESFSCRIQTNLDIMTSNLIPFKIEKIDKGDFYGFELDGNHRYLTKDFIVHHNSNAKSKILELLQSCMGDYYCILPVALITQKRAASNAASAELERTKGRRIAVLQEPGDRETLNVGFMKELTGGDRIQARGLFKNPIEFKPQFKMILTCNELPEVPSDDGGTWRRIRVIEFKSRFKENPNPDNELEFPIDIELSDKFPRWKEMFMSMLINHHSTLDPKSIVEPAAVRIATDSYKQNNDIIGQYVKEMLVMSDDKTVSVQINTLYSNFKSWVNKTSPKGKEIPLRTQLKSYIENIHGLYNDGKGWKGLKIVQPVAIEE